MEFEKLCIYGFNLLYPKGWRIEFDKRHEWEHGQITFTNPQKTIISLVWKPLKEVKLKHATPEEFADGILEKLKKMTKGNVALVDREKSSVNNHEAVFDHIQYMQSFGGMIIKRRIPREHFGVFLFCDSSDRFFNLYGSADPENFQKDIDTIKSVAKSFVCHE
jgi:hypothetical protein